MRCVPVLVLVACGAPAHAPQPRVVTERTPVVQQASCADAGPLLGAFDEDFETSESLEAVITNTCTEARWPRSVLACITKVPRPDTCLGGLTDPQLLAYEDAVAKWRYDGELGSSYVACDDAVHDVEAWPPALTGTDDAKELAQPLRQHVLMQLCHADAWTTVPLRCLRGANPDVIGDCLAQLDGPQRAHVTEAIAKADSIATKVVKQRTKPASLDCKKVVAAHYAESKWKTAAETITGAARKKLFEQSRAKMLASCTAEAWPADVRACLVIGGRSTCDGLAWTDRVSTRWGFPASGVVAD